MSILQEITSASDDMLRSLRLLVEAESPSADLAATALCAKTTASLGEQLLGASPEFHEVRGRTHLRWSFGEQTEIVVLGHFDTVWPLGTIERWPFAVSDGRASGPGIFDMKSGIVQSFYGLSQLDSLEGISILMTSDEEVGSPTSQELIRSTAEGAKAVLVLEPSKDGSLKLARKGSAAFTLDITGRAAHSGLEPEKGINALVELAHQVLAITQIARPDEGTTVSPTVASAGATTNTIPERAQVHINLRAWTVDEMERVAEALAALESHIDGTSLQLTNPSWRPPMERSTSNELFEMALEVADDLGIGPIEGTEVGGGSDGNITAAMGVPTLDGLGAVGDGAHAEGEYVEVTALAERAALVSGLTERLLAS